MSIPRYAARTAGFAALYLAATLAGASTTVDGVPLLWPAAAVGAAWLLAQAGFGRRDLDVVALSVAAAVVPATGHPVLAALVLAAAQVVPALLFAWLLDRHLPGYWRGHGDRFRRAGRSLARLAAIAATAALAGAVLHHAAAGDLPWSAAGYPVVRDTAAVLLVVLAARALRQAMPRRTAAGPTASGTSASRTGTKRSGGGLSVVK